MFKTTKKMVTCTQIEIPSAVIEYCTDYDFQTDYTIGLMNDILYSYSPYEIFVDGLDFFIGNDVEQDELIHNIIRELYKYVQENIPETDVIEIVEI